MSEVKNIPDGWVETTLGEVTYFVNEKIDVNKINLKNYISTENLLADKLGIQDAVSLPNIPKVNYFKREDVLFSNIRTYFKKVWFANFEGGSSNDVLIFRPINQNDLNSKFLYYFISSDKFIDFTVKSAKGTKMPRGDKEAMKLLKIYIPKNINEQKSIASILTAFDDKIELLQAQNKTLEETTQTIFAEWFGKYSVDDELPDGWRVGKLEEVIEFINGYAFKSNDLLNQPEIETLKVFKMGDIKKGGGFNPSKTKSYFRKQEATKLSKYILKNGDLLMCMTDMKDAISLLGHTALMIYDEEYIVNQRVGLIRAKNDINIGYPYLYLLTNEANFISDLRGRSNSGVQVNLSTEAIKQSEIVIADEKTNLNFNNLVLPLFEKIKTNTEQIQTLTKTRDELLPRLMNGEVRVNDSSSKFSNN